LAEPAVESMPTDATMASEKTTAVDTAKEETKEEASEQAGQDEQAMAE
jgi:hypothetical protein